MDELAVAALDKKIEKLEEKVSVKRKEYNALLDELSELLDQRYPERKKERIKNALYDAYMNSCRSLDEIVDLIEHADEWM